ncbi:MAG: hypothetical protein KKA73_29740, partial [Chloroflexi bacterium]|nr:hypothetical protein [Chloroflexota bacterium]
IGIHIKHLGYSFVEDFLQNFISQFMFESLRFDGGFFKLVQFVNLTVAQSAGRCFKTARN